MIDHSAGPEVQENAGTRAWDLMTDVWKSFKPWVDKVAASFGLTPQQLIAMKILGEFGSMTMSELAINLGCDASNVTSIVDKLQTRGFVERQSSEHDRRVKTLVMTTDGTDLYARARERFHEPPPAIANLEERDKLELCSIMQRALDSLGTRAT